MKNFSRPTNFFILLFLLLAAVASLVIVRDDDISRYSFLGFIGLFLAFIVFRIIVVSQARRHSGKIISGTQKISAKVLTSKRMNADVSVVQLQVFHPSQTYITGVSLSALAGYDMNSFQVGKNISVYVNPENLHEVIVPAPAHEHTTKPAVRTRGVFWTIFVILISSSGFIIPVLIAVFDTSDRLYNNSAVIYDDAGSPKLWEILVKQPDKMFFRIYDPATGDKVKSFKENRDEDSDYDLKLFICQQDKKVFVVNTEGEPLIDVYNAATYEKLSDIKSFEKTNPVLSSGIAEVKRLQTNTSVHQENIIEITSKDGNKCLYDITKNKFFSDGNEFGKYSHTTDSALMSKQLSVFVLSRMQGGVEKFQLYLLTSDDARSWSSIMQLRLYHNLDVDNYNSNRGYSYPSSKLLPLSGNSFYLKADIVYSDYNVAVLKYNESLAQDAEQLISIVDRTGKKICTLRESDLPNHDDMKDDYYYWGNELDKNCFRYKDQLVILFGKYGAISIDVTTGKQLWKFES